MIKMYIRPRDQGQIVEISYGYDCHGGAYRHTLDRSDRAETWEHGALDWDLEDEGEPSQDHIPCVLAWEPCDAPAD